LPAVPNSCSMGAERRDDVVSDERTRTALLAQLGRLKAKEDALRAQKPLITYRLEQVEEALGTWERGA
jgi:hypothetical protein